MELVIQDEYVYCGLLAPCNKVEAQKQPFLSNIYTHRVGASGIKNLYLWEATHGIVVIRKGKMVR
jgi:hypothetical protein